MNLPIVTVLVVEDLAADRDLYRRALRQDLTCGYELLETESVAAGLELCRTQSIDAILLDYLLPDGDGLDFLERLAVQSNGSNPPVVMIAGYGNARIAIRAIKLGAEDYLVKSELTPDLLLSTIRSAIENARLRLQLRASEERFQAAIDNKIDCFGIYSAIRDAAGQLVDFRFDYLNAAAMRSNRMTAADMSRTLCEVFPATRETGLMAEYDRVLKTGIPLIKEDLVYTDVFGGERLTNAYHMQVGKLDDGMMISWREITAQKQLELSLQAANRQMTTIWESMTDAYVTLDRDWRFTYANSTATQIIDELLESPTEEITGKIYWEVFPWTVGTIVEREYRRAVAERVAVHFELFYQPAETWFEIHAYPSTAGLGIYFRDINERKQVELARIAAEQERDRFFNLSLDLLIVANFDGYFVGVNPACERILGFTSAELMARPYLDFVHPDDREHTLAAAQGLSRGESLLSFEHRFGCKDGSYRWILWSAMPDVDRQLIYGSGHNFTDRKVAQLNDRFLYELTQRLGQLTAAEEIQWEAVKSLGEYLHVDRATWFEVDLERRLARIDRDWYREGLTSHAGVYAIADFILPAAQAALSAGSSVAISDVTADPFTAPLVATYEQLGMGAFVNIPCIEAGRWVATLNLNTTTVRNWRECEIELLQAVVTQLWSSIAQARAAQALRVQEQQTQAARAIVEQQLREIEAIYQTAPVGLCFVDTDLRFVRLNERLAQIDGCSIATHLGRTIREVLPELADTLEPLYRQVIESGEPIFDLEVSGMTAAQPGLERHWIVCYYPQIDAQERTIGVNVMVQEITDRKREEAQLKQAEATIRQQLDEIEAIYRAAPVGLSFISSELKFIRINEQLAQINGLAVSEHIGLTIRDVLPEMADTIEPLYRQIIESGEPIFDLEVSGNTPSQPGVERYWLASYYPQTDVSGRVMGVNAMVQEITDRKRIEAALRASERMRRFMFEQTFELIGLVDLDGVLLEVNQAALDSISVQQSEIVGQKFWDTPWWHSPQLQQQLIDAIDRAARGEVMRYEVQFPDGNGNVMITDFSLKPMFDEDGQIVKLIAEGRDITDRKQMEAALRQRESQLRLFVQHAPAEVAMFDRDMHYIIASDRWIDSYDLPDRDIVGRSHYNLFPDLPQRWKEVHQRCLAGAIESCEEDPFPRADGSLDWVRWEIHPWYTNPDEVGGIIIFSEVITERKIAEKRLQESEQRLRTGVEVAGVGLATFDYATNLVELSPEAAALYGFPPDTSTITRDQIHATFHPDERAELEAVIERVLDPQGTGWFAQDHRVVWQNGEVRCLSVRKQVFFDHSGAVARPSYAMLAAIDVTERKQNQAALEEQNQELDSFVYVVSHDLKAPLRAVSNLSEWIEDDLEGQLTADTQLQMTQLRTRVQRMAATIDGLLEYARIGRDEDEIAPVALSRLLADVIDSIAPPPTFTIDLPADLPTLSTKRMPLFQVFVNLVGNGIKHHHSEAGSIQISIEQRGDWYEFAIADDGPGIAPADRERMFKIFQAVNPQNRSDSTGIGLAIVKKIIEAEGGTIRLESELGKGTTFYFTWPRC
jgi:PAS domain S-box-containing protein